MGEDGILGTGWVPPTAVICLWVCSSPIKATPLSRVLNFRGTVSQSSLELNGIKHAALPVGWLGMLQAHLAFSFPGTGSF